MKEGQGSALDPLGAAPWPSFTLEIYDDLPSTQDECIARAEAGAPAGLAILARRQSAGRGRHGRAWQDASGNLAVSLLLRPSTQLRDVPQWSLLAGVALIEALAECTDPARLRLKWPNDVLQDGAKLAGILLDSAASPAGCDWLVIGIGVNLTHAPTLPDRPTARLADQATPPPPEVLARSILARLAYWQSRLAQHGFAAIRDAWLHLAHPIGSPLHVNGPPRVQGLFAGLDDHGALLLQTHDGLRRIDSGEIGVASIPANPASIASIAPPAAAPPR